MIAWRNDSAWASERETWRLASWLLVPAILAIALCRWRARGAWPFAAWRAVHVGVGIGVVVGVLVATALLANVASDGDPAPLPYLPLLNPLDITFAAQVETPPVPPTRVRSSTAAPAPAYG